MDNPTPLSSLIAMVIIYCSVIGALVVWMIDGPAPPPGRDDL